MSGIQYRADIDGLRAIAVLAVVLYHYGIGGLQGGFVGVDVFFVISGYLITGIIHKEMQQGSFTLAGFYERRARRIFPALFAMLLVTLIAGMFLLLPSDLMRLGQSSVATVLFVSNVLFFRQGGYFDAGSVFNALMHTWSLGVEEQFYVGLPLLLMAVYRYQPGWLVRTVALCALLSFSACVLGQSTMARATFYLSPFRAWELLLGALLALGAVPQFRNEGLRRIASVLALFTLLGSVSFMRSGVDFPGWKVAIPVLATAVLLHVGAGGRAQVHRLLVCRPLVFVGLISYSLYLWHWPVLVLVKYRMGMQPLTLGQALVLLGAVLLLAMASYRWVEQPLRRWRKHEGAPTHLIVFMGSALCATLLAAVGVGLAITQGVPGRVSSKVLALDRAQSPASPFNVCVGKTLSMERPACRIGADGDSGMALIWGDSWALAWAPALDQVLKQEGRPGILALKLACAPLPGVNNRKWPTCLERNAEVLEWIRKHRPERVYLIAAWTRWTLDEEGYSLEDSSHLQGNGRIFAEAYPRTLQSIRPYVKEIVVVGPTPGAPESLPYQLALTYWKGNPLPTPITRMDADKMASGFWQVAERYTADARTINPAPWFCDRVACRYLDAGELLYRDSNHLSLAGAQFVARHLLAEDATPDSRVTGTAR